MGAIYGKESTTDRKVRLAGYVQKWRTNNPEKQALARKRAYENRKRKAMELCGGDVCIRCGCKELEFLEFNHKNGGGAKEIREAKYGAMMDLILTKERDTTDIEILCRVCNAFDHLQRKNPELAKHYTIVWK